MVGTPFSGFITYDTGAVKSGVDANSSMNFGDYYFTTTSGISITVFVGGAVFTSTNSTPGGNFAAINVGNNLGSGYDALTYSVGRPPLVNGAPVRAGATQGALEINFSDYTATAFTSDAIPTSAPSLSAYPDGNITVTASAPGAQGSLFYIGGEITAISPFPRVTLSSQTLPGNQLRLSWPVSATGLTLQFATSLTTQDWTTEPTATEHTVSVSTSGQPKFFRLVKLPLSK